MGETLAVEGRCSVALPSLATPAVFTVEVRVGGGPVEYRSAEFDPTQFPSLRDAAAMILAAALQHASSQLLGCASTFHKSMGERLLTMAMVTCDGEAAAILRVELECFEEPGRAVCSASGELEIEEEWGDAVGAGVWGQPSQGRSPATGSGGHPRRSPDWSLWEGS